MHNIPRVWLAFRRRLCFNTKQNIQRPIRIRRVTVIIDDTNINIQLNDVSRSKILE